MIKVFEDNLGKIRLNIKKRFNSYYDNNITQNPMNLGQNVEHIILDFIDDCCFDAENIVIDQLYEGVLLLQKKIDMMIEAGKELGSMCHICSHYIKEENDPTDALWVKSACMNCENENSKFELRDIL